jgi:Zn-dependent peptidase ImmA (M78 family)
VIDDLLMELADCGSPEAILGLILKHHQDWSPPVPLRDFAAAVGIVEIRVLDSEAFEGALLTDDTKSSGVILHRPRQEGRQRFTIAHELGHYLIISHRGSKHCTAKNLAERDYKDPARRIEAEANRFAAGLLMPKPWLDRDEANQELDLVRVRLLADRYGVSLEAAANRYVELSDHACAMVFWRDGRIRYTRRSMRFPALEAGAGSPLPRITLDQARGKLGLSEWIERDGGQWLARSHGRVPSLLQQTLVQQNGCGMTLLQLSDDSAADEEADADAWEPPRFARGR